MKPLSSHSAPEEVSTMARTGLGEVPKNRLKSGSNGDPRTQDGGVEIPTFGAVLALEVGADEFAFPR